MLTDFDSPIGDQVASARVSAAGAFEGTVNGFASAGAPAASVYTVTLAPDHAAAAADVSIAVGPASGLSITWEYTQTSATVIQLRGFDQAGAASESPFYITVTRIWAP